MTMATGDGGRGRTVVAIFEGPLRSDGALTALREAGFQPAQVAVQVAPGATGGTADSGGVGTGGRTLALLGALLGALIGVLLGRALVGGTLALALGALVGALAGAAIAGALAWAGGTGGATPNAAPRTGSRPGSVTLTVIADNADQARQAREVLAQRGGAVRP